MTRTAFARVSPPRGAPCTTPAPRPRRVPSCRWERCPATGALVCRWAIAPPDLTLVSGPDRELEQPPSPLTLAA